MTQVLLVEDDPGDARLLAEAVREHGADLDVHHVQRLGDAITALEQRPFDVALLDLHLPDSQGIVTLERLLEVAGDTSVVVLTGLADDELGVAAVDAGAQDYLVKGSLGGPATLRAVRHAVERRRLRDILDRSLAHRNALLELARDALAEVDLDALEERATRTVVSATAAERAEVRRPADHDDPTDVRSPAMAAPIDGGGAIVAVPPEGRALDRADADLVHGVAQLLGLRERRLRAEADLEERVKELSALFAVHRTLQRRTDPVAVARQVGSHLVSAMERPDATWATVELDEESASVGSQPGSSRPGIERPIEVHGAERGRITLGRTDGSGFLDEEHELVGWTAESIELWLERRDALEELRRSEHQFQATVSHLPVALTRTDRDLTVTFAAGGLFERLDIEPQETLGPILDHDPTEGWVDAVRAALSGSTATVETTWRGRQLLHHMEPLLDPDGAVEATVCVTLDVTEERARDAELAEHRARLEALFAQALDAILLIDHDARIIDANRAAAELTGRSLDELIGSDAWEISAEPDPDRAAERAQQLQEEGQLEGEWLIRRPDGSAVQTEYRSVADIVPGVDLSIIRDVSRRREAEAALVSSEERFRALAEEMRDAVYRLRFRPEPHLEYVNPAIERITGFSPRALYDDRGLFTSRIHPDDQQHQLDLERIETITRGELRTAVMRFQHADGRWISIELRRTGLYEGGELVGLQGFIHDVTDRVAAQQALERSEARFRSLAEGLRDVVYRIRLEPERRLDYVNPAIERMTAFSPEEYFADPGLFRSRIHEDDRRPLVDEVAELVPETVKIDVMRFRRADDRWITIELRRTGLFQDDRIVGIQGIIQDVTERVAAQEALQRSEKRFRSLAEGLRDVVYQLRLEPERHTEYVNPAIERVTGFPAEAYYTNEEMFRSRVHPEDLARIDIEQLAREGRHTGVVRFRRADGRWIRLEVRRTGLFGDGRLVGIQGIIQDVTERERLVRARERTAEALRTALEHERRSVEDLQALDALKSSFIQSVSHELRTPLTAVIGFSRLLARRADDLPADRTTEIHERLLANAERIEQLLEDLLDTRAIDGAPDGLSLARIDVHGLVQRVVAATDLGGQHCEVVGEPLTAELDAEKVRRILEKLLHNSVKHTPPSTTITVRVIDDGEEVELVVEDDGPGIPAELHEEIFEPFRQGPLALDDPSPGTGVGLSIVARLVALHGGRVWIEDRPGGGTKVRLRLPRGHARPLTVPGGGSGSALV